MAQSDLLVADNRPTKAKPVGEAHANDWMKCLKEDTTLREILLFGTHESGAAIGKGKNMEIPEQLRNGVRFLDLHLATLEGKTWIFHAKPCITLLQCLCEIESFVGDFGKTEKIIIRLRESPNAANPVDWGDVKKQLEKGTHNYLVAKAQAEMAISKMRGSVILIAPKALEMEGNWDEEAIAHIETPVTVIEEKDLRAFLIADEPFKSETRPVWVECRCRLDEEIRQGIELKAVDNYLATKYGQSVFNIVTFSSVDDKEIFAILKQYLLPQ